MRKHIEGPWSVVNHNWHETSVFSDVTQQRICHMDTEDWGVDEDTEEEYRKEQESNAKLIAAAPDLLRELKEAREGLRWYYAVYSDSVAKGDYEAMERIEAAISKAEWREV